MNTELRAEIEGRLVLAKATSEKRWAEYEAAKKKQEQATLEDPLKELGNAWIAANDTVRGLEALLKEPAEAGVI